MTTKATPDRILQFAWGYAPTLIIASAVKHRLFDALNAGPRTVDDLAQETGTSLRGLSAISNALVGLEFLRKDGDRYSLGPEAAAFLVSTRPAFLGPLFQHMTAQILPSWSGLDETVRTGKPSKAINGQAQGANFFAEFVEALFPMSYPAARALGEHLDVSQATKTVSVLDLAAGSGVWGLALAQQSTHVHVTAVDWPEVLEVTRRVAQKLGLASRLTAVPGDILKADFGRGHQVATLGHILHSEGRDKSQELLKRTFASLASGGTIAVAEFVANDERTGPPAAMIFAVNMAVNTENGDTFTLPEIRAWLRQAGFVDVRQFDSGAGPSPLILATKP